MKVEENSAMGSGELSGENPVELSSLLLMLQLSDDVLRQRQYLGTRGT